MATFLILTIRSKMDRNQYMVQHAVSITEVAQPNQAGISEVFMVKRGQTSLILKAISRKQNPEIPVQLRIQIKFSFLSF